MIDDNLSLTKAIQRAHGITAKDIDSYIDALEKEIASLKEQLINAVEAGEFFSKYADCKKESWACSCSFCRDVDSSRKLREARQFLKNKTQARREK